MQVRLKNFRCFVDSGNIDVRPITFLVGENSAGKTTFLAGVRYLLESFVRSPQNPFNKDPYYLGGFDQIAHYRRGKAGRAKRFSLTLSVPIPSPGSRRKAANIPLVSSTHSFQFMKGAVQPELCEYVFEAGEIKIILNTDDQFSLTIKEQGFPEILVDKLPDNTIPLEILKSNVTFIQFILRNMLSETHKDRDGIRIDDRRIERIVSVFSSSLQNARRNAFASSPVRSQPLRTYTPSEINASSEGSHVPLEMARQKIGSPTQWASAHEKLSTFGHDSGLFEDIDIRRLGKSDGDPFQVVVRGNGPPVNLVDVGYGVSQALPIIYQLEQARGHDVFLLQQPEVHLHPRAQAEIGSLIASLSRSRPDRLFIVETHSDYILDRVRIEVANGRLDKNHVTIAYFEKSEHEVKAQNLYLSQTGDILEAPDSFRNFFLHEQARLLGI